MANRRGTTSGRRNTEMTYRTRLGETTDRSEDGGATAPPVCLKMFTIDQAADFASVSVDKIRGWLLTRKLEQYDLGGGRIRIDELELADLLTSLESARP